jgi:hypothetical protein
MGYFNRPLAILWQVVNAGLGQIDCAEYRRASSVRQPENGIFFYDGQRTDIF